ncbi:glutathione S-transferase [Dendryphion nanum]|uniref:Glutathione S-transferase n=1 Tax=Dendryphion nanum TaxID=256645 RepID=A0A9P9EEL3_9PLEO|nr:glutathione S-transferase [Dendryphion nanum]
MSSTTTTTPTPKLTVHHLQIGQGERIPFLLEELNLPYTLILHQRDPFFSPPELKAIHPTGASPVLEDATFTPNSPLILAESGAITEYIIQRHGAGRLALPPSHPNYADYLYWLHFSNSTLQPAIFRRFLARSLASSPEDPKFLTQDQRTKANLAQLNKRLEANTWLAGDEFTAADTMMVWCLTTMRMFEPVDLTGHEGTLAWLKRATDREGYRRAHEKMDPELDIEELRSAKGPTPFKPKPRAKV